ASLGGPQIQRRAALGAGNIGRQRRGLGQDHAPLLGVERENALARRIIHTAKEGTESAGATGHASAAFRADDVGQLRLLRFAFTVDGCGVIAVGIARARQESAVATKAVDGIRATLLTLVRRGLGFGFGV